METLGKKQRNFNKIVQEAIKDAKPLEDINYNESDIDNLLKVEVACYTRNIDYLLKVFKCEDMLYISRAIKHSTWLVKDPQYVHIINPHYLHSQLFPYMLTEARNKLLLHIRLNLKDLTQNEEFFKYLVDIDLNAAMKWFPNCSIPFILSRLEQDIYRIPDNVLLRLLWTTMEPLRIYVNNVYWKKPMLEKAMFIISTHGEEYFNILDTVDTNQIPIFNRKYTKVTMKTCPRRLVYSFNRYINFIDKVTFAKYIKNQDFQYLLNNVGEKKLEHIVPETLRNIILKQHDQDRLIKQLLECRPDDIEILKDLLQKLHHCNFINESKKFTLQIINIVIMKFCTHRFDNETWCMLNTIFTSIGVYQSHKKHFHNCIKSIILYKIIHNEDVPDVLLPFLQELNTLKLEKSKFTEEEKEIVFDYMYSLAFNRVISITGNDKVQENLETLLVLFHVWEKNLQGYPLVVKKVQELLESIKPCDVEAIKTLYKNKIWRKFVLNKLFIMNPSENACIEALKHDPCLLQHNDEVIINLCSQNKETLTKFFSTLRIFWSNSLAKDYKEKLIGQLTTKPSNSLYKLLTRQEVLELVKINMNNDDQIQLDTLKSTGKPRHIAQNMYRTRPKPPIDMVLSYGAGAYLHDALSSIKAVLHSLSAQRTEIIIKIQEWPEFIQKLYVLQTFTKYNKHDRKKIISAIWTNTKYSSVRADIFKRSYKALTKFNKNDMNSNESYNDSVEEEWRHLKLLIESLTDHESVIVYNLLSRFEKVPFAVRREYCVIGYNFLKRLPLRNNCRRFMNNIVSKIEYNKVMSYLELDVIAEMVHDTIIKRLWTEKLDWTFMKMLFACVSSQTDTEKQTEAFTKVLNPVLECAFKLWDTKVHGIFMVRYNMNGLFSQVVYSYKDMLKRKSTTILDLLLNSLEPNLPHNYVIITNFKLARRFFDILSNCNKILRKKLYEKTTLDLGQICIEIFCEDVKKHSQNIWRSFFHAWQMMLSGFGLNKRTQYKIDNKMLDLAENLSTDLNILLHVLVVEHIYYIQYEKEDKKGRKELRDRIARHPSAEVKANVSKLCMTDGCNIPYFSYFYNLG